MGMDGHAELAKGRVRDEDVMTQPRAKVPDIQPGLLRDARVYGSEEEAEAAQVVFSPAGGL
jgi:hypothetical protein